MGTTETDNAKGHNMNNKDAYNALVIGLGRQGWSPSDAIKEAGYIDGAGYDKKAYFKVNRNGITKRLDRRQRNQLVWPVVEWALNQASVLKESRAAA
jgi:hypothetical protein